MIVCVQVVEMYSSGGDLHLELPSGLEKAPQKHWVCLITIAATIAKNTVVNPIQ